MPDMKKYKILTIIGTRPEAIKLAPVVLELEQKHDSFVSKVCLTAQHSEMLDQPLALFGIRPDHDLNIMSPGQTLAQITARAVKGLDEIVAEEKPDVLLVQGDTTTAFCGAVVGYYHQIKVGHIEAGLRSLCDKENTYRCPYGFLPIDVLTETP
jgi:UDP-N-acetylglucosamine 2-epimerase (non-hydrolysing)